MTTEIKEPAMGRFSVELELANQKDVNLAEEGHLAPELVRRAKIRGVVDTGATRLVLPEAITRQLGLITSGAVSVRYADGRSAQRSIVQNVQLKYAGRQSVFNAIVEPGRESALIGAIVLEDLDFLADCIGGRLVPRDPNQIISEAE